MSSLHVLVVDDEANFLESISCILRSMGLQNIHTCSDSRNVLQLLAKETFGVVLMDLSMPHISGEELLPTIISLYPDVPVIIISAFSEIQIAVECIRKGAFDYLLKPVDQERLSTSIKHAVQYVEILNENSRLKKYLLKPELEKPELFGEIIATSASMFAIFGYIEVIAPSNQPVLITGETGSGKEMIARSIHRASSRTGEFVTVNTAGIDDHLFSDTLFGHIKGAFTGAETIRKGLIEQAENGTLFLDEIGDLRPESQVKLLRLLQERKFYALGSDIPKPSTARIVAATNCDLKEMQKNGAFRQDLFFRLQTHQIKIPPLRERKEDIPLLTKHFIDIASKELKKPNPTIPKELEDVLSGYHFPGNVRELQSMIFDAVAQHKEGIVSLRVFKERIQESRSDDTQQEISGNSEQIIFPAQLPTLKKIEKALITEALLRSNYNQSVAADLLGISRRALNNRLQRNTETNSE